MPTLRYWDASQNAWLAVSGPAGPVSTAMPPGSVTQYAGTGIPSGWLLCDGSAVSRTLYGNLFAAISTAWGVGDGSTTFNLPDLRSRTPVGAGQGAGLSNRALASTGGEENHILSAGEMPVHNHGISDPGHVHSITNDITGALSGPGLTSPSANPGLLGTPNSNSSGTGIGIQNAGSGATHNNMQPWAAINYLIKT